MRPTWAIPLLLLSSACVEYVPRSRVPDVGAPNPRERAPEHRVDSLVQLKPPEVDILWLVDNSSSMGEEQAGIANNFPVFLDFFVGSASTGTSA